MPLPSQSSSLVIGQSTKLALIIGFAVTFFAGVIVGSFLAPHHAGELGGHDCAHNRQQQQQQHSGDLSDRSHHQSSGNNLPPVLKDEVVNDDVTINLPNREKLSGADIKGGIGGAGAHVPAIVTRDASAMTLPALPVEEQPHRAKAKCPANRRIQGTFSRFIDIDFIEWVTGSCPDPSKALVLDIGLFHGGEVAKMARLGFSVIGFEPNPVRYGFCKKEIEELKPAQRARVELHNAAVSDQAEPLYFQLAGVDSHAYFVPPGGPTKIKTIVVPSEPISTVFKKHRNFYFVKIDTQGFDTRILESMLGAIQDYNATVEFIQFEYSPHFEVTRSQRTADDHKRFFRLLQDAGYDVFMGAVVQPWLRSMRGTYGKSPLSMISPEFRGVPTCIDDFVDYMHRSKQQPIRPGQTSNEFGSWCDLLAVRRSDTTPYFRNTGWVLARKM